MSGGNSRVQCTHFKPPILMSNAPHAYKNGRAMSIWAFNYVEQARRINFCVRWCGKRILIYLEPIVAVGGANCISPHPYRIGLGSMRISSNGFGRLVMVWLSSSLAVLIDLIQKSGLFSLAFSFGICSTQADCNSHKCGKVFISFSAMVSPHSESFSISATLLQTYPTPVACSDVYCMVR